MFPFFLYFQPKTRLLGGLATAQKTELNTRQSGHAQHTDLPLAIRFFDQHRNQEKSRVVVLSNQGR
ncbi:MAG: hypothetical protein VXZ92_06925, partial [SAR324 cluster bacterium]|nr:hypothetical protein [SAR324 cluster bacterium]